jgi:hypothetical protein
MGLEESDFPANIHHKKFCLKIIAIGFCGVIFTFIGHLQEPDCSNISAFHSLGSLIFLISSLIGFGSNLLTFYVSITDKEYDSIMVFAWSFVHVMVVFFLFIIGGEALITPILCSGDGPFYDWV